MHQRAGRDGDSARGSDRGEGQERQHTPIPAAALLRRRQRGNGAAAVGTLLFLKKNSENSSSLFFPVQLT